MGFPLPLLSVAKSSDDAIATFKDLFLGACPKYLSVNPPPYEDAQLLEQYMTHPPQDPVQRHVELFLNDVKAIQGVNATRNLLKLYTSIDAAKLSAFLEESGDGDKEEEILQQLMVLKAASRTYARGQSEGSLLDGDRIVINNLDFTIDGSMVHVEETTSHRRYAGYLIRNAEHAQRVFNTVRAAPLPSKPKTQQGTQATTGGKQQGASAGQTGGAWGAKKAVRIAA